MNLRIQADLLDGTVTGSPNLNHLHGGPPADPDEAVDAEFEPRPEPPRQRLFVPADQVEALRRERDEARQKAKRRKRKLQSLRAHVSALRRALEAFDVLPAVNMATTGKGLPVESLAQINPWLKAICAAAELVKAGMLDTADSTLGADPDESTPQDAAWGVWLQDQVDAAVAFVRQVSGDHDLGHADDCDAYGKPLWAEGCGCWAAEALGALGGPLRDRYPVAADGDEEADEEGDASRADEAWFFDKDGKP